MDSKNQSSDNQENQEEQQQNQLTLPIASISLALSTILPTHFLTPPKISTIFNKPNKVKIPTQISSLYNLTLSSSLPPTKPNFKSTISSNPLQNTLTLNPLRPNEPSNAAAIKRASIVWFRNDLRVHDNECLNTAHNESMSVLPVYCFDPRDYGKSSSGFDKTGPYRASFLIESVADLKKNLQARGSDLVVRIGKPETVLVELAKSVGAEAVYAHREVSHEEVKGEDKIENVMKDEGLEMKYFWGSTLYHVDDLPFKLEEMPTNYGGFREKVQGLEVRKTIEALDQLKGLPARGDVEPGEIPSLVDLGLNPSATMGQRTFGGKGSALVVRIGKPETVSVELATAVGAEAVYAHREVSYDEVKGEDKIENVMKDEGLEVKYFWGSILYHVDDSPFKLEEMLTNYGGFGEKVQGLEVRKTIEALDQLKGLPARGDVEPGEIPSLADLGLNPSGTMGQNGKQAANASLVGGENEALQRLRKFAAECQAQPNKENKDGTTDSIYGANFSCKISPWLAMGCLSPRSMFDELKKSTSRTISAASGKKDGGSGTGLNWLMYELLWRDFFRFITKKYSAAKQNSAASVTACVGAAA